MSGDVHGLVARVIGRAGALAAAYYEPILVEGLGALALLLFIGVVLPAVWSRRATRRRAATTVLRLLLTALFGPRVGTAVTPATAEPNPPSNQS